MGKGGKTQQAQAQSQKKGGGQQHLKQTKDKPSRGCCGCIFSLIRKLIVVTALAAFLYVATFTGYHYSVSHRMPTVDEFKGFSLEWYKFGSEQALGYYGEAEKHTKVYYAHFEKEYLPTIQLYTKRYTKLAGEKAGELKDLSVKYFAIAQKQVEVYYKLALKKIEEFQSGKEAAPTAAPKRAPDSKPPTPKPTTAAPTTQKPTQAPQTAPPTTQKAAPPRAAPTTPKPTPTPKPAEAAKKASNPSSKEKKSEL